MSQSRQLAAIMFTDIAGYTTLMGEDEQLAFELLKKNRSIQRPIIEKFNGRWIKEIGDGVLASFSTVSDAVYCAKEIQEICQNEPELSLRIGIHLGEVVFEGNDVFGDGVNIASRLEPLAPVGGILVSESVHRNLGNKKDVESTFIREEQLRNVREPIRIYSVQVVGAEPAVTAQPVTTKQQASLTTMNPKRIGLISLPVIVVLVLVYFIYPRQSPEDNQLAPSEINDKSIAVLPFKNLSSELDNQYFADGVQEAVLNHLSKISALKVISRTSVEQYRETVKPISKIGKEIEVAYVLEGSVQKAGDQVRITVQLIAVDQDHHIWADNYDRNLTDIFNTQSEIAERIAAELKTTLNPQETELIRGIPTSNIEAYDYYLRAKEYQRRYLNLVSDQDYKAAMELMMKSLKSDPEFALVYVSLGKIFMFRNTFREYFKENPMDSVLLLANQALELNPDLADAYLLRAGYYYFLEGFKSRAKNDMETAISLDPNNPDAYATLGSWNRTAGHYPDALKNLLKAKRLVRGDELENLNTRLGYFYASIGDYQRAMEITDNLLTMHPDYLPGLTLKAHLNRCQGKFHLNLPIAQKIIMLDNSGARAGMVGIIFLMNGNYQQAEMYFEKYFSLSQDKLSIRASDEIHMYVYTLLKNGKKELAVKKSEEGERHFLAISNSSRPRAPSMGYELAKLYAMRGEKEKALMWLKDYEKFGFEVGLHDFARYDPPFENLWEDPEFEAILQRVTKKIARERKNIERLQEDGYFDNI